MSRAIPSLATTPVTGWRAILGATAIVFVAAILLTGCADTAGTSPRAYEGTPPSASDVATQRYHDPNGYFTILPPAGWRIETYPGDPRGKVAFHGPTGVELRILVSTVDYDDFETMLAKFQEKQRELSGTLQMDLETIKFQDRQAVKKTFAFRGTKFVAYDYMVKNVHHDLQYGAPVGSFDKYLPLVTLSMETYEPAVTEQSPEEARKAAVAKRLRLAELFRERRQIGLAQQMVREGLELAPENAELLRLKRELSEQ